VNQSEQLIADALRDIAAEAPAPRQMADVAWQAGRRRRLSRASAAASAGAGAVAAAIALPLALAGSPGQSPSVLTGPTLPVSLRTPIQFRQVASISGHSCRPGSPGLPGPSANSNANPNGSGTACYQFTHQGMTVTVLRSARVIQAGRGQYVLNIRFTTADAGRFAALTRKLFGQPTPRCQLAIIVGGRVISSPTVEAPMTTGQAQIDGFGSHAQAERLLHQG
jgi:SecDF, P1 head subdomain